MTEEQKTGLKEIMQLHPTCQYIHSMKRMKHSNEKIQLSG